MPTRSLPDHPSLDQLKRQAKELQRGQRERRASALARIAATHPHWRGRSPDDVATQPCKVADAQLVLAREYGFESWARLKHHVELAERVAAYQPHPHFDTALAALRAGAAERLRQLLGHEPELAHARTNLAPPYGYFTGATLLHHVAGNPGWDVPLPPNMVEIARVLLDAGADANAFTLGPSVATTMGLILTSKSASDANLSGPLMDLLLERGAVLDLNEIAAVIPDWRPHKALQIALENHAYRAADKLIELGARFDLFTAAAMGRMDLLPTFFTEHGQLRARPRHGGKPLAARDAIGLALLYAYVNKRTAAVDFLLEHDGNWNMIGVGEGTALHRAAWEGDLPMVQRLIANGADSCNRENLYVATPLSWAQHNKQDEVFAWLRANTRVDIHDGVGFHLLDVVEARLREDPACVNRRIDQWDSPQSTPLYWAAWTKYYDVAGEHHRDEAERYALVLRLLDAGADPNIVAGDGYTALDVALTAGAASIARLLAGRGGKRGAEL